MAGIDDFVAGIQPACAKPAQEVVFQCPVAWVLKSRTGKVAEDSVGLVLSLQPSFFAPVTALGAPAVQADEDADERYGGKQRRQENLRKRHFCLQLFEAHNATRNCAQDSDAYEPRDNPFRDP